MTRTVPARPAVPPRPAGRPRRDDATASILDAVIAVVRDRGLEALTVEAIAESTGVARTTIYRRWPNVQTLAMEAFFAEVGHKIVYPDTGSLRDMFTVSLTRFIGALAHGNGDLLRALLAKSQTDATLREAFRTGWIAPRRAEGLAAIARADDRARFDGDPDLLLDAIFGAVYYRLMIPYAPLDGPYAIALVDQILPKTTVR